MHLEPGAADLRHNADGAQQSRGIVDQEEERRERHGAKQDRQEHDQLVDILLHSVLGAQREHQREYEERDAVSDDVVAQQRRRDDPRRHLRAGDLNRHQQRTEREDHKRKRRGDDRPEQRLGARSR